MRVLAQGLLLTLSGAVRDGADIQGALRLRLGLDAQTQMSHQARQVSRTVPLKVNAAIRNAKGVAASHLKKLTAQQAELEARRVEAEEAAAKKRKLVDDVAKHAKELAAQDAWLQLWDVR